MLSKSDPMVVVYMKDAMTSYSEVRRTEVIMNNLDPVFARKITLDYDFERVQQLLFEV